MWMKINLRIALLKIFFTSHNLYYHPNNDNIEQRGIAKGSYLMNYFLHVAI